jgi:hypothetical protein
LVLKGLKTVKWRQVETVATLVPCYPSSSTRRPRERCRWNKRENEALVRWFFEEAWGKGNLAAVEALFVGVGADASFLTEHIVKHFDESTVA